MIDATTDISREHNASSLLYLLFIIRVVALSKSLYR